MSNTNSEDEGDFFDAGQFSFGSRISMYSSDSVDDNIVNQSGNGGGSGGNGISFNPDVQILGTNTIIPIAQGDGFWDTQQYEPKQLDILDNAAAAIGGLVRQLSSRSMESILSLDLGEILSSSRALPPSQVLPRRGGRRSIESPTGTTIISDNNDNDFKYLDDEFDDDQDVDSLFRADSDSSNTDDDDGGNNDDGSAMSSSIQSIGKLLSRIDRSVDNTAINTMDAEMNPELLKTAKTPTTKSSSNDDGKPASTADTNDTSQPSPSTPSSEMINGALQYVNHRFLRFNCILLFRSDFFHLQI